MPATPKVQRTRTNYINDYALKRVSNTAMLDDALFTKIPATTVHDPSIGGLVALVGYVGTDNTTWHTEPQSLPIPLGFSFRMNGEEYDHIVISMSGYCIIGKNPDLLTHVSSSLWNTMARDLYSPTNCMGPGSPHSINLNMTFDGVLVAPWFSINLDNYQINGPTLPSNSLASLGSTPVNYIANLSGSKYQNEVIPNTGALSGSIYYESLVDLGGYNSDDLVEKIHYGMTQPPDLIFSPSKAGVRWTQVLSDTVHGLYRAIQWCSFHHITYADLEMKVPTISSSFQFQLKIFENGRLEFTYRKLRGGEQIKETGVYANYNFESNHAACVGVFTKNGFRDFTSEINIGSSLLIFPEWAPSLGGMVSSLNSVERHPLGGISTPAQYKKYWSMPTTYYNYLLTAYDWPCQQGNATSLVFQPPAVRRKLLPRVSSKYDGSSVSIGMFDDQKSTIFSTQAVVSYPAMISRNNLGYTQQIQSLEDILSGTTIQATGSTFATLDINSIAENDPRNWSRIKPFSEHNRQIMIDDITTPNGVFFVNANADLTETLQSKNQINIELPIQYTTPMLGLTSSIMYYDTRYKQFLVKNPSDLADGMAYIDSKRTSEDYRGFGPLGNLIVSGSDAIVTAPPYYIANSSDDNINNVFNEQNYNVAIQKEYAKSICINQEYVPSNTETFSLPINEPFIIEKAMIELPLEAGKTWFDDVTRCVQPYGYDWTSTENTFIDIGGPLVTVALFAQTTYNNLTRQELILSATITNCNDFTGSQGPEIIWPLLEAVGQIRGINSFLPSASTIVYPNKSNYEFTGSVKLLAESAITNGVIGTLRFDALNGGTDNNRLRFSQFVSTEEFIITSTDTKLFVGGNDNHYRINWINNIGRNQDGFVGSGQSIFGREQITSRSPLKYKNKYFYMSDTEKSSALAAQSFTLTQPICVMQTQKSPYVIFPNQKLTLAVSKTRPCVKRATFVGGDPNDRFYVTGTLGHDIKIPSGSSVKITFFGSYLREAKEFHDVRNTKFQSTIISDVIGNDPALDQFEVYGRRALYGTYNDAYVTGSMSLQERKKQFNIVSASQNTFYDLSDINQLYSDTVMQRDVALRKQFEVAGIISNVRMTSQQIIYDSFVPSLSNLLQETNFPIANISDTSTETTEFGGVSGILWSWCGLPPATPGTANITDNDWPFGFPFESRYASIDRSLDPFISVYDTNRYWNSSLYNLNGLAPDVINTSVLLRTSHNIYVYYGGWANASPTGFYSPLKFEPNGAWWYRGGPGTVNISRDEIRKIIFGFGDLNNIALGVKNGNDFDFSHPNYGTQTIPSTLQHISSNTIRCGANHLPQFKTVDLWGRNNVYGVMIRGWKYGLFSGITSNTSLVFRRGRFGQFRDMLEQGIDTKMFVDNNIEDSPVQVRFVNPITSQHVEPETTWSSNLSLEATSSLPYFDGEAHNRSTINPLQLNQTLQSITTDSNGNLVI
jgi:hypothetical protein